VLIDLAKVFRRKMRAELADGGTYLVVFVSHLSAAAPGIGKDL